MSLKADGSESSLKADGSEPMRTELGFPIPSCLALVL